MGYTECVGRKALPLLQIPATALDEQGTDYPAKQKDIKE